MEPTEGRFTSNNREIRSFYERYTGVCDVYSPEQSRAMVAEVREHRKDPNRKVMIGVMTHPLTLRPDLPDPHKVREVFPKREELSGGFIDDEDALNTIHYADLYGPDAGKNLLENLELCIQYGGANLNAIQLDVTWPNVEEIDQFKAAHPEIKLVLQVGKFALKAVSGDPKQVVDMLDKYGDSIDYALLDTSMGKGQDMEAGGLLPMLRTIRKELPGLGLAVAGGLGPDSTDLLQPIADEFPDISIDAQGNLKHKDAPRDDLGHLVSTYPAELDRSTEYLRRSCALLDKSKPGAVT